ncbi:hypothetical protein E2C01_051930 [Portunus trituberculatus]|uniref:Uncharacterized protein n=1 Tax=Portunus trituberculatus TaxID=210409 RepID=A0A5B7GLR4_PORTR|nr:hypothetical protein [Portunus trituberculatus]
MQATTPEGEVKEGTFSPMNHMRVLHESRTSVETPLKSLEIRQTNQTLVEVQRGSVGREWSTCARLHLTHESATLASSQSSKTAADNEAAPTR